MCQHLIIYGNAEQADALQEHQKTVTSAAGDVRAAEAGNRIAETYSHASAVGEDQETENLYQGPDPVNGHDMATSSYTTGK